MTTIKTMQKEFLTNMRGWEEVRQKGKDSKAEWAANNTLNASLQRNQTYNNKADFSSRECFREDWKKVLHKIALRYTKPISAKAHVKNIESIRALLSKNHGKILARKKLRFGTSQKALNLYLKYLWCLGKTSCPPHCPLDGIILRKAGIGGSWTKSNSIKEYEKWIAQCQQCAKEHPWIETALQKGQIKKGEILSCWELKSYME